MKTTAGSQHAGGRVSVWPLQNSGEITIAVTAPTGDISAASLDAHAAHVIGTALIQLAVQAEAADRQNRSQIEQYRAKYDTKVAA
jgi:hypothetical protein